MRFYKFLAIIVCGLVSLGSFQVAGEEFKSYVGSPEFEKMKQLIGTWEGTMDSGQGPQKITTSYKLTSGGSAIMETTFEGAPHEMVTIYHDNSDKRVTMTHYCALGNQPTMTLKKAEGKSFIFDLSKDADINVGQDQHMHSAMITFKSKDQIIQQWTSFGKGKQDKVVEIAYSRVK